MTGIRFNIYNHIVYSIIILLMVSFFIQINLYSDENIKNNPLIFSMYFKNKISYEASMNTRYDFNLKNEINLTIDLPYQFYYGSYWFDDIFLVDFLPLSDNTNFVATDLFFNSFTTGIDNRFKIKQLMTIYGNFEFGVNSPFYDNTALYFNPILGLEGNYYYGFFWRIEQSLPIDYTPVINNIIITSSTYVKGGYEFFRFYGPRNFILGLLADNLINLSYPIPVSTNIFEDDFKTGLYMGFFGVTISGYFILENSYDLTNQIDLSRMIGMKTGISYINQWVTISFDYTGMINSISTDPQWINRFDFYIKAGFYIK